MSDSRMWAAGGGLYAGLVAVLLLAHFGLRPLLTGWTGAPDLLTGALLLAALRLRAGYAAALGFGLGLLEASMALEGMGPMLVLYTLLGFVAAKSRDLIFAEARVFVPLYVLVGTWSTQVVLSLLLDLHPRVEFILVGAPVSALLTTIVCWLVIRLGTPALL